MALRCADKTKDFKPINLWNFMKLISTSEAALLICEFRGLINYEEEIQKMPKWLKGDWDEDS